MRASICIRIMCIQSTSGAACVHVDRNKFNGQIFILFWGTTPLFPLFIQIFFGSVRSHFSEDFPFSKIDTQQSTMMPTPSTKNPGKSFFMQWNINIVSFHLLSRTFVFSFQSFFFFSNRFFHFGSLTMNVGRSGNDDDNGEMECKRRGLWVTDCMRRKYVSFCCWLQ